MIFWGLISHVRDLYLWAASVMTSRCFPGAEVFNQAKDDFPVYSGDAEGKAPVLIPGLDLLNHDPSSHVAWVWNSTSCAIQTDDHVSGGCEVSNNYGPKNNEERRIENFGSISVR